MSTYVVRSIGLAMLVLALQPLAAVAGAQTLTDLEPPPVPATIRAPEGQAVFFAGRAVGTQNFICLAKGSSMAWTFTGPQATLFLSLRRHLSLQLTTHFLSPNPGEKGLPRPTWQHSLDTSSVWGRVLASSNDPAYVAPGAIPWLLLEVAGAQRGPGGSGLLTRATFIHRVNTTGGLGTVDWLQPADGHRRCRARAVYRRLLLL